MKNYTYTNKQGQQFAKVTVSLFVEKKTVELVAKSFGISENKATQTIINKYLANRVYFDDCAMYLDNSTKELGLVSFGG